MNYLPVNIIGIDSRFPKKTLATLKRDAFSSKWHMTELLKCLIKEKDYTSA